MALTTVKQGGIATDAVGTAALDQDAGFTLAGLNGSSTVASEGGAVNTSIQQGVAKAWINYKQAATFETRDSLNISSVTDDGNGLADTNYTNNFNNDDYAAAGAAGRQSSVSISAYWTFPTRSTALYSTSATAWTSGYNGGQSSVLTPLDMIINILTIHGDLA